MALTPEQITALNSALDAAGLIVTKLTGYRRELTVVKANANTLENNISDLVGQYEAIRKSILTQAGDVIPKDV